jgi:curved DNA-binding protein CbpA
MKSIAELDHYELLEIPRSAGPGEIERAYRLAQQTYGDGSLALYSVFETGDAEAIRAHLDEAYQILATPELRAEYDRQTQSDASGRGQAESGGVGQDSYSIADAAFESEELASFRPESLVSEAAPAESHAFETFDEVVEEHAALEDEVEGDYDGVRLRRARMFRGYEIDDISEVTKVSGTHLRNIEDENFADLPADVYVRGFVTAYAKTIGLDPTVVVPGYMSRVVQSRSEAQGGGFLGRH